MTYRPTRSIPDEERIDPAAANEAVARAVSSWPGVSSETHAMGGVAFRYAGHELGHLHEPPGKVATADLHFPRSRRAELIESGVGRRHVMDRENRTGWVTVPMRTAAEVDGAIALFREAYERRSGEVPAGPDRNGVRPHRVALITGASRGLGATLARFLAVQGYALVLTARGAADLAEVARELESRRAGSAERAGPEPTGQASTGHASTAPAGPIVAIPGDVADPSHRRALASAARSLGRLDLLVNNASGLGPTPLPTLARYPLDELAALFRVNVLAPLGLVQETLPLLEASRALVVNVSSDAAVGAYPGWGGYGATKAALELASRTLATELASKGVAVVTVDPGDMRTRMQQEAFPGEDISDRPAPESTIPFWAWLLGQPHEAVGGRRFQAQAEVWEVPA